MSHSTESELPSHWKFAFSAAFSMIEHLMWSFDFEAETGKHAYATVPEPNELIEILNGFLTEQKLLYGGDITNLQHLRDIVKKQIAEAYRAGQVTATDQWQEASLADRSRLVTQSPEEIRESAWRLAPSEAYLANWFTQGYCRRWAEESFQQIVRDAGKRVEHQK